MRYLAFALMVGMLGIAAPAAPQSTCKNRCESDYRLCQKRAANTEGRKTCRAMRKSCERGCGQR